LARRELAEIELTIDRVGGLKDEAAHSVALALWKRGIAHAVQFSSRVEWVVDENGSAAR
jgi:hypothetical protein